MIAYGCILPHSPSLYNALVGKKQPAPPSIEAHIDRIAENMVKAGVTRIVCISGHPRYQRLGFSAYSAETLHLGFSEFGDLVNEITLPMDWQTFTALREADSHQWPIGFHPINDTEIDYGHALPLWMLADRREELKQKPILLINDFLAATPDERLGFGSSLAKTMCDSPEVYGLIVSMEAAVVEPDISLETIKERNAQARHTISAMYGTSTPTQPATMASCSAGSLLISQPGIRQAKLVYHELAFEHTAQTSILIAECKPA